MNRFEIDEKLEQLEERLKRDREITYDEKLKQRNYIQRLFNIQPDMTFCDMCISQDRIFSTKKILESKETE